MIAILALLLCWLPSAALQLSYPGQTVEAASPVPIVRNADPASSFSTLHPGERYRVAEVRQGRKLEWLRLDIPKCSSCWVDAASVNPLTSYEPEEIVSAESLLSFVSDRGQHIVVYARPSVPPEAFPLEVFVVFGQRDQKSCEPVQVLAGTRQVLPVPPTGGDGASDQWTLVVKPKIGLCLRLFVNKVQSARKLPPDNLRTSIKGCDLCRFEPHIPSEMNAESLEFFGPASILPSLTGLTERPYLSIDVEKWRELGSLQELGGTIVSRNHAGAYLELPVVVRIDEALAESAVGFLNMRPSTLVLFVVILAVAVVLAVMVFKRRNHKDDTYGLFQRLDQIDRKVSDLFQLVGRPSQDKSDRIMELKAVAKDLERKNAELEQTNKKLSEQIERLNAEAGSREVAHNADVEALRKETDSTRSMLQKSERECQTLRSAMVFLDENGSEAVRKLIGVFETIELASEGIQGTIEGFFRQDTLNCPNLLAFSRNHVDAGLLAWVHSRRLELQLLCDKHFSSAPEIMEHRGGQTVSAEDLFRDVRDRFFHRAVADKWDKTLRLLQQFYRLPERIELPAQQTQRHQEVVRILRDYEARSRQAMCGVGVEPLQVTFLSPVPADLKLFVEFVRREAPTALYPRLRGAAEQAPELVLDVLSWGYLNDRGELWRGQKAKLVVSS